MQRCSVDARLDPTLHRLSTLVDVASIKRRAAPKLFRTRRLANGQVIRTRAGPGVQAKFHEIRDEMAESRRARAVQTTGDPRTSRTYAFDDTDTTEPESPRLRSLSARSRPSTDPSHHTTSRSRDVGRHNSGISKQQSPPRNHFWDRGREHIDSQIMGRHQPHAQPQAHSLECIEEGIASSWGSSFDFPPIHSLPVTGTLYRQGTSSFSAATGHTSYTSQGTAHMSTQQGQVSPDYDTSKSSASAFALAVQSCPASIHTSPVLRPAVIPPSHSHLLTVPHEPPALLPNFIPSPLFGTHLHHLPPIIPTQGDQYGLQQAPPPFRIAEPAAPNPFDSLSISPISGEGTTITNTHHRDSVASALSALSNLSTPSSVTDQHSVLEWRGGTIDPRWVSPSGSVWSTPAATPRSGSPVAEGEAGLNLYQTHHI